MPRPRKSQTEAQTDNNNTNTEGKFKMPLNPDQIRAVYAKRRTKGLYSELIAQFIESGEGGISVKEEWGTQFADKKATSLKQGFENAKDKKDAPDGADMVDVIVDGEDVYLLNRAVLEEGVAPAEVAA